MQRCSAAASASHPTYKHSTLMPYAQLLHAALQYGGSATALESISDPDSDLYLTRVAPQKPEEEEEDATLLKLASTLKALSPCPTGQGPLRSLYTAIEHLRDSIYPLRALAMPATHKAAPCTPQFSAVCEAGALAFEALAGVDFSASTTPARELCAEVLSVAACCTSLHLCARSFAGCCSGRPRGVWRGALQGRVLESLASSANSGLFNCEDLDSIASQTATYLSTFQRLARVSGCDEEEGLALPPPLTQGAALCLSTTKLLLALRGSVSSLDWARAGAVLQWEGTGTPLLSHSEGSTLPTPPPSPHLSYLSHALSLWKGGRVAQCAVDELFFSALCIDRVRLAGLAGSCDPSLGVEAQDQHWEGVHRAATSVESSLHHIEELSCSRDGSSSSSNSILSVFSWGDGVSKVVLESKARASIQTLLCTLPLTALHGRAGSLSAPVLVQQLEGPGFSQPLAHLEAVIEGAQRGLSSAGLNCSSPLLRSAWLVHSLRSLLLGADPHSPSSPLAVIGQCSPTHSSELACVEGILSRVMREEGVQGVMRAVGVKFDPEKGDDDGNVGAKELHPAIVDEVCLLISTLASHRSSIALAAAICNPGTTPLVEALEAAHTVVTALPAHLKALVVGSRSGAAESTTQLGASGLTPPPLLPSLTLTSLLRLGAVVLQCRAAHSIAQTVTAQGGGLPSHLPSARLGLEEALGVGVDKGVIILQPKPSTNVTLPLSVASTLPVDVVASAEKELGGVRGALAHMVMAEALQRALDTGKPTFKPGTMVLQWGVEGEGEGKGEAEHGITGGGARYAAGLLSALVSVEEGQNGGVAASPLPLPLAEQLAACRHVVTLASAVDGGGGVSVVGEVEDTLRTWPFSSPPPSSLVILSQHIIHTNLTQGLQAALYNDVTAGVCGPPGALRLTNVSPTPLLTALGSLRLKGSHVPLTATTLALAQCAHTLAALRACTLFEVSGLGDSDSLWWSYEEGAKVCGGGKMEDGEEQEVVEEGLSTSDPTLVKAMRDEIRVILLDREARRVDGTLLACLDGEDVNGLGAGADMAARAALLSPPSDRTPNTNLLLSTMALFQALALENNDPWCCVNILRRVRVAGVGGGGKNLLQPSLFPCGDLPTPPTCLVTVLLGSGGGGSSSRASPPSSSSGTGGDAWEGMVRSCRETVSGTTTLPLHPAFFPKLRTHLYSALIKVCDLVLPTLLSHLPGVVSISSVPQPPSSLRDFSSSASWISACLAACGGVTTAYLVPHFDRGGYVRVRDTMRVANLLRDANIAGGLGQWEVSSECLFQAVGVLGPIKEGKPPPANPLHPQDTLSRLLQCPVVPNEYPPLHASSTALFKHLQLCWSLCLTRAAVACALTLRVGGEGEGGAQHLIRAAIGALSHSSASATDTTNSFSATQLLMGLLEGGRQWCGARSLLAHGDKGDALELAHASLSHLTTSVPPIANWPSYLGTTMTAETTGINSPTPTSLPLLYLDFVAHVQKVSSEVLNDLVVVELDRCLARARGGGGKGVGDFSATEQRIQGWIKGGGVLTNHTLECLRVCKALFIMGGGEGGGGDYSFIKGLTFPSPWIAAAGQWVEGTVASAGGEVGGSDLDWALKEIEKALAVNELLGCGWEIERWMTGGRVGGDVGSIHLPSNLNGSSINSILSRASASMSALERVVGIASSNSGGSSTASSSSSSSSSTSPPLALLPQIAHASTLRTALIPLATALAHMRECVARVLVGSGSEGGDVGGSSLEVLEGALKASATLLVPSPFLLHSCNPWFSSTSPITKEAHLVSMHCQYLSVLSHLGVFCNGGSVASEAQCIEEGATLLGRLEGGKGDTQRGSASSTLTLTRALHCATLLKRVHGAVSVEGLWGLGEELGLPCDAGGRSHTTLHQLLSSSLATPPFSLCNPTQHTHTVLTRGKLFALDVQCAMVVWASLMEWGKVALCGGLQLPHLYDLGMEGEEDGVGGEWCNVTPLPLQHIVALANTFSDSPLLQQPWLWVCGGLFSTARALHTLHCNWGGVGFNPALTSELEGLIGRGEGIDWRGCWGWGRFSRIVASASASTSTIPVPPLLLPSPLLSVCIHALFSTRLYTALEGVITLARGTSPTPISPPIGPSASWEGLDEGDLRAGTVALEEGLEAMRANLSSSPAILSTFPPTLLTPALHHHRVDTHPDALPTLEFIECALGVRKAVLETEAFGVEAAVHEGSSSTTRPSLAPLTRALARLEGLCSTTSPGLKCLSTPGAALLELARGLAAQECLLASCCLRCATLERGALRALVTESPGVDTQSLQTVIARHHSAHAGALSLGGPLTPWAERLLFTSTALLSLRQSLLGFVAAKDTPAGGPLSALVTHRLPLSPLLAALYECRRGVEEGFFLPPCISEVEGAQEVFEETVFGCVMVPILEGRVVGDGSDVGEMVEAVCKACEASGIPPSQALSHSAFTTLSAARVASALLRAKASGDPQTMMQALGATVAAESSGEEKEEGDTHAHSHLLSFALTSLTTQVELLGAQGNLEAALQGMQCSEGCVGVSWAVGGEVGRLVLGSTPGGEHGTASRFSPLDPSHLASTPLALEAAIMEAGAILAALTLSSGTGSSASATATAAAAAPLSSLLPLARAVLGLRKGVLSYLHGGCKADDWRVSYESSVVHEASGLQPSPLTAYTLSEAHLCMGHGQYLSHLAALESALDEGGGEGSCTHALQIPIPANAAETFLAPLLQFPAALPLLSPLPACPPSISLPDLSRVWEGGMTPPPALNPTVTAVQGFLESGVCPPGGLAQRTLHPLITLGTTLATARRALAQGLYEEVLQAIDGGVVLGSLGVDVGVRGVRELYLIRELALGVLERIKAAQALSALLVNPQHTHPEPVMDALAYALSIGLPFDPVLTDGEHAQLFTMALDRLCVHYGGVGYTNAAWVSGPLASGGGSGGGVTRTERGRRAGRTHL